MANKENWIILQGGGMDSAVQVNRKDLQSLEKQIQGIQTAIKKAFDAEDSPTGFNEALSETAVELKQVAGALKQTFLAEKQVKRTTTTIKKDAQATVAAFDQLNRLNKPQESVRVTTTITTDSVEPAMEMVQLLEKTISQFSNTLATKLAQVFGENGRVIVGFGGLNTVLELVGAAMQALSAGPLGRMIALLSGNFLPVVGQVQGVMAQVRQVFQDVSGAVLQQVDTMALWRGACQMAQGVASVFSGAIQILQIPVSVVTQAIGGLISVVSDLLGDFSSLGRISGITWGQIQQAWSGAWKWFSENVVTPFTEGIRKIVNGIIGFINGMLSAIVSGINGVIQSLNKLHFEIPFSGGKKVGFQIKTLPTPKIPYLAKGAVLPANQPFLAMVGDQRHGTNVEAPLATIQEAVAAVMQDQTAALMAGLEASVGVQKAILEAVLGIQIGDEVIASAYDRYNYKTRIMRGGL